MRAFVTGANGLIGANLVRELIAQGAEVRAMTRVSSDVRAIDRLAVERVTGDVLDAPAMLAPLCSGCDVVFHTAAHFTYAGIGEDVLERTALAGTRNVIESAALAGVPRVVVTSSSVVFGSSATASVRDETAQPGDDFVEPPYVVSKIRQDALAAELGRTLGVEVIFVCPTMSVGPHATTLGPSNGVIVAYLNDPLRMTYPGGCNIVSVRDVARGHWLAAVRGAPGEHYLLGAENLTWVEIHAMVAGLCGVDTPRVEINHTAAYLAATYEELRAKLQRRAALTTRQQARMIGRFYWYSHAKAGALGYAPMPARAALAEACAWLAMSPHISREVRATMSLSAETHAARRDLAAY